MSSLTVTHPSLYKQHIGPLRHQCSHCSASGPELFSCSTCRVVRYCSRGHQNANRQQHEHACELVTIARQKLAREDTLVRHNLNPSHTLPENAFETDVGYFWEIYGTRAYVRARFALVSELLVLIGTLDGVEEAMEHLQDLASLCLRSENETALRMAPAVLLRLDLDRECYNFVQWTAEDLEGYQWKQEDFPKNQWELEDLTRPSDIDPDAAIANNGDCLATTPPLEHIAALLLLKLKLIVDIRNIKVTRKIIAHRKLPFDISPSVELALVRSPLSVTFVGQPPKFLGKVETDLVDHAQRLAKRLQKANPYFIFHLFEPDEPLAARPNSSYEGTWEEMTSMLQHCFASYWETEGVLSLLEDARAIAARESGIEIDYAAAHIPFTPQPGPRKTPEDLLRDMSADRVWSALKPAVEDFSYLGPWSSRPSQRQRVDGVVAA